jgi:undecaprenyl-diphosphatase
MKLDMKMKVKLLALGISGGLFLLLMLMVRSYDVAAIGPMGTEIGFAQLNGSMHDTLGTNLFWYDLTEIFGFLALGVCGLFGFTGLVQLLKRRSLKEVDPEILALGVFYVLVIGCYVLFELVVINYRPVIMPGVEGVEASFPSSHTMLICSVMGSTAMVLKRYIDRDALRMGLQAGCVIVAVVTVAGRLLSGVHWLTDILGGVLLSCALLAVFSLLWDFFATVLTHHDWTPMAEEWSDEDEQAGDL